jgi:O-methyltransferase involved in polyketide biosynthesis
MKVANVPEDLFKPVYFRAKETQRLDGIIKDLLAVEIVERMSPDSLIVDDWTIQFGIAVHTLIVDVLSNNF